MRHTSPISNAIYNGKAFSTHYWPQQELILTFKNTCRLETDNYILLLKTLSA